MIQNFSTCDEMCSLSSVSVSVSVLLLSQMSVMCNSSSLGGLMKSSRRLKTSEAASESPPLQLTHPAPQILCEITLSVSVQA